jgi:hypothetical protein
LLAEEYEKWQDGEWPNQPKVHIFTIFIYLLYHAQGTILAMKTTFW